MENRAAKSREKYDDDDVGCSGSDRISRLPDPVLHHILCFLSQKKAVQTSVLSKSWRHLGPTRPVIDLHGACRSHDLGHVMRGVCENCFCGKEETFISVLEKTFQRYHEHNLFTHQLDLYMLRHDSESISVLEKWIPKFINAVTTFRLSFHIGPYSNLPSVVFEAEYLRELHLHWCKLNDIDSIGDVLLKNLQKLSLSRLIISNEALEKIISGCPLVKRVVLFRCYTYGFKTINIGNKNPCLNSFEISCCYETSIEIDAPTLESIRIEGSANWYPNNTNNYYFPHLKFLYLSLVKLTTDSFHNFSCNFPRLQELTLLHCSGFQEINISSRSIIRLIIHGSRREFKKFAIEVPNILYFESSRDYLPTTFSLTTTSKDWKSQLYLRNVHVDDLQSILELSELVKELSQSQISLTLSEHYYFKIDKIQWDFNDHPVEVENLGLKISKFCSDSLARYLNAFFRIFRPKYTGAVRVRVHSNNDEEVTKFLWKTLILEREKREYDWEQHLEEVSIEASDEKGKVWHHFEETCLPESSKNQKIRFRLKWRDYLVY